MSSVIKAKRSEVATLLIATNQKMQISFFHLAIEYDVHEIFHLLLAANGYRVPHLIMWEAARHDRIDLIRICLESGKEGLFENGFSYALDTAIIKSNLEMAKILIAKASTKDLEAGLKRAKELNDAEILDALSDALSAKESKPHSPFCNLL